MFSVISRSIMPILKWGTVIVTTAVVVISIQVVADADKNVSTPLADSAEPIKVADVVPEKGRF